MRHQPQHRQQPDPRPARLRIGRTVAVVAATAATVVTVTLGIAGHRPEPAPVAGPSPDQAAALALAVRHERVSRSADRREAARLERRERRRAHEVTREKRVLLDQATRSSGHALTRRVHIKPKAKPQPVAATPAAPDLAGNRALGYRLMLDAGFDADQWPALEALWTRESGWNHLAANPSGAYGIPQALPGSKMSSAGADWATNPATQIRWGLGYIRSRYGTPTNALAHSNATGWY